MKPFTAALALSLAAALPTAALFAGPVLFTGAALAAGASDTDAERLARWNEIRTSIFGDKAVQPTDTLVTVDAPVRALDAALVPITLTMPEKDKVAGVSLVIDDNPSPYAANITFGPAADPGEIKLRVRVNNYTNVHAVVRTKDGGLFETAKFVKASGGCSAPMGMSDEEAMKGMGDMRLEWLGKAVNWSKFTATAALGVIHRGNLGCGLKLLSPYLPKDSIAGANSGSAYSQGGSLYAMGLIYANHETFASELIRKQFNDTNEEVVQHGAALGLGCASMATGDEGIFEDLKNVLYSDSAINGEAVGVAMGLVMLGTGNLSALENMIQYAHETQHEKIIRGLSLGMALIMYGRQEAADELVNGLLDDPDPILRYGGIQTIMLAYCGSGSNKAVRRLLHVAVSDVSDDVRRVAVMALGFILFRKPKSVPRMVELLSESYNPHVRYGAAMALGISCAGTGLDEAIDLLEPMIKDPTDFVRQGALIALSMIMVQQNEVMNPKVGTIRKTLQKAISDRHEDAMTKFGSAVSLGIIDAGGRNCTISLQTQTGNLNMAGIVGMAVFTQYWYWFPLTHFLSLSFTPTAIIAVDHNLNVPAFKYHSATRPSLFDYPPEQEAKIEEAPKKVETAVLSTTAQAKRRALQRERKQRRESDAGDEAKTPKTEVDDKMDTDEPITKDDEKKDDDEKEKSDSSLDKPEDKKHLAEGLRKKLEKEKVGYELENLSRVLPPQVRFISFPNSRYKPVKKPTGGVILVNDTRPDEKVELKELRAKQRGRSAYPPSKAQQERDLAQSSSTRARGAQVPGGVDPIAPLGAELNEDDESGAAAGASILNALDEGEEEADVPREFQYDPEADESDS